MKRRYFNQMTLRAIATGFIGSGALTTLIPMAQADALPTSATGLDITVYRDPACGCCHEWVNYLKSRGFQVTDQVREDMEVIKRRMAVPPELASCHTAVVAGYVIEGHVPVEDIQRLVTEQSTLVGIAAPGMPIGSPGMEIGDQQDAFAIVAFDQAGRVGVINRYPQG